MLQIKSKKVNLGHLSCILTNSSALKIPFCMLVFQSHRQIRNNASHTNFLMQGSGMLVPSYANEWKKSCRIYEPNKIVNVYFWQTSTSEGFEEESDYPAVMKSK